MEIINVSNVQNENQKKIKVVPIAPGECHLQNEVIDNRCYICKKNLDELDINNMVMLRLYDKKMVTVCTRHRGVVSEFIKQYKIPPLNWRTYAENK